MAVADPHRSFAGVIDDKTYEEHALIEGPTPVVRKRKPPWVTTRGSVLWSARAGIGRVLRVLARLLYLSPLLFLAKIVIRAAGGESDLVTVGFATLVVVFFLVLDIYLFVSVLWWFGRLRAERLRFILPSEWPRPRRVEATADPTVVPAGERVVAEGTIALLGEPKDAEAMRDLWVPSAPEPIRVVEIADFAVVAPGRATVVVRCETAPLLVSSGERALVGAWLAEASEETRVLANRLGARDVGTGDAFALRVGDLVRVVGGAVRTMPDPMPESEAGSPYRRAGAGVAMLVGEVGEAAVRIEKLRT
jgi:hypothetical protein